MPGARLSVLALGTFVLGVDGFVLPGLLHDVAGDLSVSVATAGQLTTAFSVAYAVGSPIIATVTGRADRRAVIGAGMAVFLVGMVLQALGPTYPAVLAGRVVAALGAAAFQANAFAVAGVLSRPERRARAFAVIGAGSSLATVLGVPFGLLLGQWWGWRGVMWVIAGLAAAAMVLTTVSLPSVTLPRTSLRDRLRVLTTPRLLVLLGVSALVLAPLNLVTAYSAALVGVSASSDGAVLAALLVFGAGFFLGNRALGRLADRFTSLTLLSGALTGLIAVMAALAGVQHRFGPTLVALFVLGLLGTCLFVPQQDRVFGAAGDAAPVALGLNGSMIYVGTALGAALGGTVLSGAGAVWLAPSSAVLGAAVLALVRLTARDRRTPAPSPTAAPAPAPTAAPAPAAEGAPACAGQCG
ncbi:MFS transporter [Actinomadura gamaensis]|uniref:MFS transporter n=1 Tax=Actinomadura gamaensis TaxID=1763541 RepID=A0ABV9TT68_9ACTN